METTTEEREPLLPTRGQSTAAAGTAAEPPHRMSWGAIFGGAITSLAVGLLLYSLGVALGLTAFNLEEGLQGTGIFTGVWGIVTALLALFVGGVVAGRGAGRATKAEGAMHGLVMWGLTTLAGTWMLINLVGTLVGGVATVGGQVAGQAGTVMQAVGIDAQTALAPINERLRAEGRPELTPQEFEAASSRVAQDAVRTGSLDRQMIVTALTEETRLTPADAEMVASEVEAELEGVVGDAPDAAVAVAETTGRAFWAIFGALALGLAAAVFGATVGARQRPLTPKRTQTQGNGRRREVFNQPRATS